MAGSPGTLISGHLPVSAPYFQKSPGGSSEKCQVPFRRISGSFTPATPGTAVFFSIHEDKARRRRAININVLFIAVFRVKN